MFNSYSFFLHLYIFLASWYFSLLKMCFFPHNLHTYMKWLRVRQFAKLYGEEKECKLFLSFFSLKCDEYILQMEPRVNCKEELVVIEWFSREKNFYISSVLFIKKILLTHTTP